MNNKSRARRRWLKWRRYEDKMIKVDPDCRAVPGQMTAYNEEAWYFNSRYYAFTPRGGRYRRWR